MNQGQEIKNTIKTALITVGSLFVVLVLMSTVFRISGAIIAPGNVGVDGNTKQITHATGGVISEVLVKNGAKVKKGQVLMRLDSSVSNVSSTSAGQSLQVMLARRIRLEAERDGRNSLENFKGVTDQKVIDEERKLFSLRRQALAERHAQMRERMNQITQSAVSIQAQINSIAQQRELFEKERDGIRQLYEKGLVTLPRYNQTERTAIDLEAQELGFRAQLAQSQAQIAEIKEQNSQIDQTFRSEAGNELASLDAQLAETRSQVAARSDQNQRNQIIAPHDGIVDKLTFTTVGSYLPAGQLVLEIVPISDRQIVEVQIAPQDIDQVKVGQKATLHFTAFSQQTTPSVPGKVEWVSAERNTDPTTGFSYYLAHIGIEEKVPSQTGDFEIKVGMPVEAYIQTESRTIMSYILKPMMDQIMRAFR